MISIIIPTLGRNIPMLSACVKSIHNSNDQFFHEIIIVATDTEQNIDKLRTALSCSYIQILDCPRGSTKSLYAAWNTGCEASSGKTIIITNDDVIFGFDAIPRMHNALHELNLWCVFPLGVDNLKDLQHVPQKIITHVHDPSFRGWCFCLSREAWETIGKFNERFQLYNGDDDYWFRLRASGHKAYEVTGAWAFHYLGATRTRFKMKLNKAGDMPLFNSIWRPQTTH